MDFEIMDLRIDPIEIERGEDTTIIISLKNNQNEKGTGVILIKI